MDWNVDPSYLITEILNPTPTVAYDKYPRSSGVLDTSISQTRMLGITQNLNKRVKVTIDYHDSKFKPIANHLWACLTAVREYWVMS